MHRGGGGRNDLFDFGDHPFGGFGGFGAPGNLLSNFFGGRDPFEDPFFTRPLGSVFVPSMVEPNMFPGGIPFPFGARRNAGRSMFGPSMFPGGNLFGETRNAGFLEQQAPPSKPKGPIIQELSSDAEEEEEGDTQSKEKTDNLRKHSRSSKEPYHVEDPDEKTEGKKSKHMQQYMGDFSRVNAEQPQAHTYSFQSSTVTYGGPSGAYYTSSTTRRSGGDGVIMEEKKEADTATRKATHKISRGIRDKGHSVTRKLNTDGRVETLQTLHNLNEDEVAGFEESWKGNARKHLPGWNQGLDVLDNGKNRSGDGGSSSNDDETPAMPRGGRPALPSTGRSWRMNSHSRP